MVRGENPRLPLGELTKILKMEGVSPAPIRKKDLVIACLPCLPCLPAGRPQVGEDSDFNRRSLLSRSGYEGWTKQTDPHFISPYSVSRDRGRKEGGVVHNDRKV